jgi:MFS family permease
MSRLKAVAAAVPGPAVVIVGKWLDLFSQTPIANPEWEDGATKFALAVGAFVATVLCLVSRDINRNRLIILTLVGFGLTLVCLAVCWGIWFHLGPPKFGERAKDSTGWQDLWETFYIAGMILLITTISAGSLAQRDEWPVVFWIVVGISLLALGVIAYAFLRQ